MVTPETASPSLTPDDHVLPFQIGQTAVRGHAVRLGTSIDKILKAHNDADGSNFNEPLSRLVGEAGALVTMMGAALKFNGKLIFQIQGDGPVSMVVADYQADGSLRATASLKGDSPLALDEIDLQAMFGKGHIAITIDQGADMERYQGVTPLDGQILETAIVSYFQQSEQIPIS